MTEEWMLIKDNDDNEHRLVKESVVDGYLSNDVYSGKWELLKQGKLEDMQVWFNLVVSAPNCIDNEDPEHEDFEGWKGYP